MGEGVVSELDRDTKKAKPGTPIPPSFVREKSDDRSDYFFAFAAPAGAAVFAFAFFRFR